MTNEEIYKRLNRIQSHVEAVQKELENVISEIEQTKYCDQEFLFCKNCPKIKVCESPLKSINLKERDDNVGF